MNFQQSNWSLFITNCRDLFVHDLKYTFNPLRFDLCIVVNLKKMCVHVFEKKLTVSSSLLASIKFENVIT